MSHRFMGRGKDAALILDSQNAAAAYSVRKLRTAYTGNCMLVHNNAFGSFLNIGFDSEGYLNVGAIPNTDDWRVRTWYDQTGNGLDMTTSGYDTAPRIKNAGVLEVVNALAALRFDGVNDLLQAGSTSSFNFLHNGTRSGVYAVAQFGNTAEPLETILSNAGGTPDIGVLVGRSTATQNGNQQVFRGVSGTQSVVNLSPGNEIPINTQILMVNEFDADNATAADRALGQINANASYQNNAQTNAPSVSNASRSLLMGRFAGPVNQFRLNGFVQETIIFDTDQGAQKTTLQNNINNYYSIY